MSIAGDCQVAQKPLKRSQVEHELDSLDEALTDLENVYSTIEGRLVAVSRSEPTCSDNDAPEDVLVPVADNIRSCRRRVENVLKRLYVTLDLLEL